GNLPFVDNADLHYARAGIFTPADVSFSRDGIAAESSENIETMVVHDVDVELLRRHKLRGTVQNWNDRRRDLYAVTWSEEADHHSI
ncbi:MAG: carbon-nitrogen hydrolase, partial [Planctomycetes bacterium]|nr:carbon-nitrogen hydrolase [Planctomycetota bacterium]